MKAESVSLKNQAHYESAAAIAEFSREVGLRPVEADLIAGFFPAAPARVLDLGCGAGRTTRALSDLGYDVTGIDRSPTLLAQARERHPSVTFAEMDATALEFDAGIFDAALFSYNGLDEIHPLPDRLRCLREVHRVLGPSGVFICSSHNALGAIFSGGYFYVTGYVNAARFLARQITNPFVRDWYLRYEGSGGAQYLYSAPPSSTIAQLAAAGFELVHLRGASGEQSRRRIDMRQPHVNFVARKCDGSAQDSRLR